MEISTFKSILTKNLTKSRSEMEEKYWHLIDDGELVKGALEKLPDSDLIEMFRSDNALLYRSVNLDNDVEIVFNNNGSLLMTPMGLIFRVLIDIGVEFLKDCQKKLNMI
jgi:hypothetical protein